MCERRAAIPEGPSPCPCAETSPCPCAETSPCPCAAGKGSAPEGSISRIGIPRVTERVKE